MVWSVQKIRDAQQVDGSNNLACGHAVHRMGRRYRLRSPGLRMQRRHDDDRCGKHRSGATTSAILDPTVRRKHTHKGGGMKPPSARSSNWANFSGVRSSR